MREGTTLMQILDLGDIGGTVQLLVSVLFLYELIKIMDAENTGEYIQERIAFYGGFLGRVRGGLDKVWGFLKLASSGFQIIANRIFPTKKQLHNRSVEDMDEIFQMEEEEDPFEGEGGIEG